MNRVCLINDISGHGRCSITMQMPVISAFGDMVSIAPTTYLSNHTGYEHVHKVDLTGDLKEVFKAWDDNNIKFDAFLTGYIGNADSILDVKEFVSNRKLDNERSLIIVDPVLGDHGKLYDGMTDKHIDNMKKLITISDAITPNLTEACLLTGIDYEDLRLKLGILKYEGKIKKDNEESKKVAEENVKKVSDQIITILRPLLEKIIFKRMQVTLITGIELYNSIVTILDVYNGDNKTRQTTCNFVPKLESRPGTGDLFDALFLSFSLKGYNIIDCLKLTTNFISNALRFTIDNNLPKNEGVCIEPILVQNINAIIQHTKVNKPKVKGEGE